MADLLQEVAQDEIPKVLEVFKKDWPKHFLIHQYISMMEEYRAAKVIFPRQALYRYGKFEDGVYIVQSIFSDDRQPHPKYFIYTTSTDLTDLSKVLMNTTIIPWNSMKFYFEFANVRFKETLLQATSSRGLNNLNVRPNYVMIFPPEDNLDVGKLPDDIFLDFLNKRHIPEVNENWTHGFPGSDNYLALQTQNNFGLGLFRKGDKKLLTSALCFHNGGIFVLYSAPEFRGRGYAELIVRNMVKEIRQRGKIPFAVILVENTPSQKLFTKIGFKTPFEIVNIYP